MGRLSEYEPWDDYELLRANEHYARDESLTCAYVEGRNAARAHKPRTVPQYYDSDTLAAINWETGYDDYLCKQEGSDTL